MGDIDAELDAILYRHVGRTGGLISALRDIQDRFGFLPDATEPRASHIFNLTRADVRGVVGFYADFSRARKGKTVIRLCAAEACQAAGGRALQKTLEKKFALTMGETSASGDLTLEPVYCLGLCSCAPAAMVGGKLVGRAAAKRIEDALNNERAS